MVFELVLAFVHWGYVYHFHCIIIEHIPECLVWWDFVSYVSYYPTLGHTPILELIGSSADFLPTRSTSWSSWVITLGHTPILGFIRSFADFLTTQSISWSLRVIILGHTPFSAFLLGHTPSLWVYRVSCCFHGCWTHLSIFASYHLGHPPTISLSRASPFIQLSPPWIFILGLSVITTMDFHPWAFEIFTTIDWHLWAFLLCHHRRSSPMGLLV